MLSDEKFGDVNFSIRLRIRNSIEPSASAPPKEIRLEALLPGKTDLKKNKNASKEKKWSFQEEETTETQTY